jgi:hypothetical protein
VAYRVQAGAGQHGSVRRNYCGWVLQLKVSPQLPLATSTQDVMPGPGCVLDKLQVMRCPLAAARACRCNSVSHAM